MSRTIVRDISRFCLSLCNKTVPRKLSRPGYQRRQSARDLSPSTITKKWDLPGGRSHLSHLVVSSVEERDHLGTVAYDGDTEDAVVYAIGDAPLNSP